jgi:serine/threonine protein kinase/tetratricopeptide (TPR) repeat protein
MIGQTLSHYRIIERVGSGGMGEVFRAEDTRLHRVVALKVLHERAQSNEQARLRFLREARAASALSHPNITTIYEIDEVEQEGSRYSFIVMEYVSGRTLGEAASGISTDQAIAAIRQAAEALAAAHERGIVHRDIKPANLVIGDDGRLKVLDFGIAKFRPGDVDDETGPLSQSEALRTVAGTVMGTFAYMSPEQALGHEVDSRSDIFSLGVVFYELLVGKQPFRGDSAFAVVDAILHADPPPPTNSNRLLPPGLDAVVRRMLEKDLDRRYQSMRDVGKDLDQFLRSEGAEGRGRHSGSFHGTSVLASSDPLETNVFVPGQLLRSGSESPVVVPEKIPHGLAVLTFANVTRNSEDDWIGTGIAETVTSDLKLQQSVVVIGRERIFDVLRQLKADVQAELDEKVATQLGRLVGAEWIISGGYQRIGQMLRITARLVDVETGEILRTVKIDGRIEEIFELQDRIVGEFSADLELQSASLSAKDDHKAPKVIEAYEAFTKGAMKVFGGTVAAVEAAVELFTTAIRLDPEYARAYVGLGYALALQAEYLTRPELYDIALSNLKKAIEIEPRVADGYNGFGLTLVAMGQGEEAIRLLAGAQSQMTNDANYNVAVGRAYFIARGAFHEAAREFDRALELNPHSGWAALQLAHCCTYLGEFDRGEAAARKAIASQDSNTAGQHGLRIVGGYVRLGQIYYLQERYDDAIAEFYREIVAIRGCDHALKDRMEIEAHQRLLSAYSRQGNADDAKLAYDEVLKGFEARTRAGADDPFTRYYVACAHAVMGDRDRALESLEVAARLRPLYTRERAKIEVDLKSLSSEPRFADLIK